MLEDKVLKEGSTEIIHELSKAQTAIHNLRSENNNLKDQLNKNSQGVQGLLIQLDACKELLNQNLNSDLQLRTKVLFLQKSNKEFLEHINALKKKIDDLENKVNQDVCKESIQA
jgi:FtsZ-binding cell division protein ZapB